MPHRPEDLAGDWSTFATGPPALPPSAVEAQAHRQHQDGYDEPADEGNEGGKAGFGDRVVAEARPGEQDDRDHDRQRQELAQPGGVQLAEV